jgi:hypothetical protein
VKNILKYFTKKPKLVPKIFTPELNDLVYTVMSEGKTTHHVFLLDLLTENYKLIRTLEHMTRQEALEYVRDLATSSADELHTGSQKLGAYVEDELRKFDKYLEKPEPEKPKTKSTNELK